MLCSTWFLWEILKDWFWGKGICIFLVYRHNLWPAFFQISLPGTWQLSIRLCAIRFALVLPFLPLFHSSDPSHAYLCVCFRFLPYLHFVIETETKRRKKTAPAPAPFSWSWSRCIQSSMRFCILHFSLRLRLCRGFPDSLCPIRCSSPLFGFASW